MQMGQPYLVRRKKTVRFNHGDVAMMLRILKVVELPREGLLPIRFSNLSSGITIPIDGVDTPVGSIEEIQVYCNHKIPEKLVPENRDSVKRDFLALMSIIIGCYNDDDGKQIYFKATRKAGLRHGEAVRIMVASCDKMVAKGAAQQV